MMFAKFQLYSLTFIFISCKQLLSAADRWWQMLWKNLNEIFIYVLKMICVPNFRSLGWFSFSSAVNSFWQLSQIFFWWDLHLHPEADTCAKFQLSRLIFIFISCQQLLTAVDSWWQLSQIFFWWDLHLPPKADTCAKFQLSRLLGGSARECDVQTDRRTHRRTPGEDSANSALLCWC